MEKRNNPNADGSEDLEMGRWGDGEMGRKRLPMNQYCDQT
jgi:hypothetical protein